MTISNIKIFQVISSSIDIEITKMNIICVSKSYREFKIKFL